MKVSTDEVGINVTWKRGTTLRVVKQLARKRTLAAAMIAIVAYIVAGHWLLIAVAAIAALTVLATLTAVAFEARKLKKHPPVNYSAIAHMEREVWGETFEHAGAPKPHPGMEELGKIMRAGGISMRDLLGPLPPGVSPRCPRGHRLTHPNVCKVCQHQRHP